MRHHTRHFAKKLSRQIGGYALLVIGVAGCVLPILPGIPFIFAGLALLAVDGPWAERLLIKLREKWRHLTAKKPAAQPTPPDVPAG